MIVKFRIEGRDNIAAMCGILAVNGYKTWKENARIGSTNRTLVCVELEEEACTSDSTPKKSQP